MLDQAPLLRRTLAANALFSALTGLALVLAHGTFAAWLGVADPRILLDLGVLLLAFGLHLFWASRRRIAVVEALYFVVSDALWVAGTAVLLIGFPAALSAPGRGTALAVAAVVAGFAVLQTKGLREGRASTR